MKDYKQLLAESQSKLDEARIQKARIEEQIATLVNELDIDPNEDILTQCQELKKALSERMESIDSEIEECQKQLEEYEKSKSTE